MILAPDPAACETPKRDKLVTFSIPESHLTGLRLRMPAPKGRRPSQPVGAFWKVRLQKGVAPEGAA